MALDRTALRQRIIALLESELQAVGFDLLDVRLFLGGGRLNVRITIDAAAGVDLDACARASRTSDALLEESGLVEEAYVLEVSSPGVRRPLRTPAHFAARIGERVEVRWGDRGRPRETRGVLLAADGRGVTLRAEPARGEPTGEDGARAPTGEAGARAPTHGEELRLSYGEIVGANLEPDVDFQELINADRRRRREEKRAQRQAARDEQKSRVSRRRRPPVQ